MTKKIYRKSLIIMVTVIFTIVSLSSISKVFCSMKDMSSCCCKEKAAAKSCCTDSKAVRFVSGCPCEIKEANKEPAELTQSYTVVPHSKISVIHLQEISIVETEKQFLNSTITSFHPPTSKDINILKCVLRI